MVATASPIDATTALQVGLVTEVVPAEQVPVRVDDRIAAMEALHPGGLRDVKRFFSQVRTMDAPSAATSSVDALVLSALRLQRA
jgi:enoyl-CoA hydratase/carnithine racemase